MLNRRFALEATTLIVAAALCAFVANAFASRDRKLNLVGNDPRVVLESGRPRPPAETSRPAVVNTAGETPAEAAQTATLPVTTTQPVKTPRVVSPPPPPPAAAPRQFPPHPEKAWVEIDSAAARELYARGTPFIDARRTSVYEEGHIKGARSIPVWESDLNDRLKALYEEGLDTEAPVVVYCSGGNCEDSHMLSERLWGLGFNNVLVYKDGYPDWVKNGGPTQTGASRS